MSIKRNYSRKKFLNLTVVVPIYSKTTVKNFSKCLKSILHSSALPKEILICIDGPISENLKSLLTKHKSKYIKFFTIRKNIGLGKLLSRAIPKCKFSLIARLDSDECASSKRFEIQYKEFKKKKNLALLGGYSAEISKKNIFLKKVPLDFSEIIAYSKFRNPFNHSTVMFKKKEVLNVGGYKHQPFFEDYLLWVKLIKKNNYMLNIPKVFSYTKIDLEFYRRRKGKEYYKHYIHFNKKIYKLGHLYLYQMIINIIIRLSVFLPLNLLRFMYVKLLR